MSGPRKKKVTDTRKPFYGLQEPSTTKEFLSQEESYGGAFREPGNYGQTYLRHACGGVTADSGAAKQNYCLQRNYIFISKMIPIDRLFVCP